MPKQDPRIDAIAAADLVSSATLAALVGMLGAKGLLSDQEVREVYEQALYLLERQQTEDAGLDRIYEAARAVLEEQLKQ